MGASDHRPSMRLFCLRLVAAGALVGLGAGCAPEVVLATSSAIGGSAGTGGSAAGGGNGGAMAGTGGNAGEPPGGSGEGGAPDVLPARLLADSVADFSFVQGQHGWYYGYDEGSSESFTLMTRQSVITLFEPPSGDTWNCWASDTAHWTQLFELGGHPNGTKTSVPSTMRLERAVRRWISTYAGPVRITGEMAMLDAHEDGNGVDTSVVVDGASLYSEYVAGDDWAGLSYELTATVSLGSTVDFVIDPHESQDNHDLARFTAVIERLDVPTN